MSEECIHGFDRGLCDVCYPKAPPEPKRAAPIRKARPAAAAPAKQPVDVGEQRIYHLTHIRNLERILDAGQLLADAADAWDDRPQVDIASSDTRETRQSIPVGDASVANYVPFFLAPNSTMWDGIRLGQKDSRLSADAYSGSPYDFVVLVSSVRAATEHADHDDSATPQLVVTDGDAAGTFTRFSTTDAERERALRKLRSDADPGACLEAEFLVKDAFPFAAISVIGVANDKVRGSVKDILEGSEHHPKVSVYPPWFQRPAD